MRSWKILKTLNRACGGYYPETLHPILYEGRFSLGIQAPTCFYTRLQTETTHLVAQSVFKVAVVMLHPRPYILVCTYIYIYKYTYIYMNILDKET